MKKLKSGEVKSINSPESLSSPDIARPALQQLHAIYQAEILNEQEVHEILGRLRHVLESEGTPATDREAMLTAFDEGLAKQFGFRTQLLAAEKDWIDAVDNEYAFAAAHGKSFRLAGNKLAIDDGEIRAEFNTKIRFQEGRRQALLKAKDEYSKSYAELLGKMGLSGKDVGIQ
jgi:hypothetical protein